MHKNQIMKKKVYFTFLFICTCLTFTDAQNIDSIHLVKEIDKVEEEINKVYQNAIIQNEKTEKISEEINTYSKTQLEELAKLKTLLEKNSGEFKSINNALSEIDSLSNGNTEKLKKFEIRNYIVQFVLLGLLVFLIIFIIRFRRQSLDYLLTKANNLADQNDVIIEKADELNTIKDTLKALIAAQTKKAKEERKIKKKKKKK